ncbi:hypothetical protein CsatB_003210 [Cannabis sativa]
MVPELDHKPKLEASMRVSFHKDNITTIQQDHDDSFLPCLSNYKDDIFDMEESLAQQTTEPNGGDNEELDIIGDTYSCDDGLIESNRADVIESSSSSSFGDSVSERENSPKLDGDEVQSRLRSDRASISEYDEYYDAFRLRKKKMTPHWRMYIRPIMWRCKWMELRIKELRSQAMKYDRELEKYDDRKQREFDTYTPEGFGSKSLPFSSQIKRNKVMKRKKRKRVEQTIDLVPYMSQHNFFSYYESKSPAPVSAPMEDNSSTLGKASYDNDEFGTTSSFEFQDGDDHYDAILLDIEKLRLRVQKLIPRVKKMVSENSEKISSINKLNIVAPCNGLTSSAQNTVPPENRNGLLILKSAVSSHGEVTPHSEMTVSKNPFQIGCLYGTTEDEVLIDNEQAKEELHDFKKLRDQLAEKPDGSTGEQKAIPTLSEAVSPLKAAVQNVKSNAKKRYRGKRKAKTGSRR